MNPVQLNPTESSDLSVQPIARDVAASGSESEAAFALLYSEALALSSEQGAGNGSLSDWLENETNEGGTSGVSEIQEFLRLRATATDTLGSGQPKSVGGIVSGMLGLESGSGTAGNVPLSSMGRILSSRIAQVESRETSSGGGLPTLGSQPDLSAQASSGANMRGAGAASADSGSSVDKNQLVSWMDAHALTRSSHHCAMYCRLGLESAGFSADVRPGDAGDYGPYLVKHGAQIVPAEGYVPQVGDTVVFDKTDQHPSGHIEIFDGHQWVSDFMQRSFSPYRDVSSTPTFTIYRLA